MGEGRQPERVEIDVISTGNPDPSSPFARPGTQGAASGTGGRSDQRAMVTAVAVLLALAIGWVLGRAGAESTPSVPDGGASAPTAPRTAAADPEVTIEAAPEASGPADETDTTDTAEITSATPVDANDSNGPMLTNPDVPTELLGQPIEIIAYGNGGNLMRLVLTSGQLVTQSVDRQPFGRPRLLVTGDGVVLPSRDAVFASTMVRYDGSVTSVGLPPSALIFGVADEGAGGDLWVMSPELLDGFGGQIERVTLGGDPTGEVVAAPVRPSQIDPAGGFVVEVPGGVFRVTPTDTTRLTSGELVAIGLDSVVVSECDDGLVCALFVVDRATGERTRLDVQSTGPERSRRFGRIATESIAPGGSAAVIHVLHPSDRSSGQPLLGIIDFESGLVTEIGPAQDIDRTVWTPDGRFVVYISGARLVAFDRTTGSIHQLADELIAIDDFAVRPAD